jgi:hypothetical protein
MEASPFTGHYARQRARVQQFGSTAGKKTQHAREWVTKCNSRAGIETTRFTGAKEVASWRGTRSLSESAAPRPKPNTANA